MSGNENTPSTLKVTFVAHLRGVGVLVSQGPNARDPMGQGDKPVHFPDMMEAIAGVPRLIADYIERLEGAE